MITVAAATAGAGLLMGLLRKFNKESVANTALNPARRPAKRSLNRMNEGYKQAAKDQGIDKPADFDVALNTPPSDLSMTEDLSPYASNGVNLNNGNLSIRINPQADEANFAHELGHVLSRQTPVGKVVRDLRDNPKLKTALLGAMMTVPSIASALEAGDDDLDTAIALGLMTSAPAIVDETAANINAYKIMNRAGKRGMDGRQMGRLAGGYLSYLAAPILAATAGNLVGNQLDSDY